MEEEKKEKTEGGKEKGKMENKIKVTVFVTPMPMF
jgi:hypothetical protein